MCPATECGPQTHPSKCKPMFGLQRKWVGVGHSGQGSWYEPAARTPDEPAAPGGSLQLPMSPRGDGDVTEPAGEPGTPSTSEAFPRAPHARRSQTFPGTSLGSSSDGALLKTKVGAWVFLAPRAPGQLCPRDYGPAVIINPLCFGVPKPRLCYWGTDTGTVCSWGRARGL